MRRNSFTINQVRRHWDSVAVAYDHINRGFGWTHTERFSTLQALLRELRGGTSGQPLRVLNVWSRTGGAIPYLRALHPGAEIHNLEASSRMLEIARAGYQGESFRITDLHDLPFDAESMDLVVSLETLEHVPDPLHFLLECSRVLKVGGHLVVSCPPAWAEAPLRLYERFFENHGEGPHRFPTVTEVLRALKACELEILNHRGSVLLPVGPQRLKLAAERFHQSVLQRIGVNRLGIRHFYVTRKPHRTDHVWLKIREEILRPGLSMQSGTCIGLSGGTLELDDPDGRCLPRPTGAGRVPQICYDASPEVSPDYPAMTAAVFGQPAPSPLLGVYRRLAAAHATDERVRRSGASGGLLTAVLLHLLDHGRITGAVVLTMDRDHPWRAVPTVARSAEELLAAAQSKYVVSPVNVILDRLVGEEGPLAYVGLPHQVFAIRSLQQMRHPSVGAIRYVLGPFFGNELTGASVGCFLRKFHASKSEVTEFSYRAGEWPGYLQARLRDGRVVRLPKFHANYLIPFYITDHSLLSHDLTNELTDLSGGDAWAPVYEERRSGFSLMIVRSEAAETVIREMEDEGKLEVQDLTESEVVQMQSHGLDLKKRGALLRLDRRRRAGRRVYEFNLPTPQVSLVRRSFETVLGWAFSFCRSRLGRGLAVLIPHSVLGPLFEASRKVWKAATKDVKREGLRPSGAPD
jgi:coenzyme F420 hydrogenase subunit beta